MAGGEPGMVESRTLPGGRGMASVACSREPGRRVIGIRGRLVVGLVARIAIRRDCGVVVVDVAIGAGHGCVCSGQRERSVVVIERGRLPGSRVVAKFALLREP